MWHGPAGASQVMEWCGVAAWRPPSSQVQSSAASDADWSPLERWSQPSPAEPSQTGSKHRPKAQGSLRYSSALQRGGHSRLRHPAPAKLQPRHQLPASVATVPRRPPRASLDAGPKRWSVAGAWLEQGLSRAGARTPCLDQQNGMAWKLVLLCQSGQPGTARGGPESACRNFECLLLSRLPDCLGGKEGLSARGILWEQTLILFYFLQLER